MLVLSPDSTCDVCMENYTDGASAPHAISCGHIFCQSCLIRMQPQCPLCRYHFNPLDLRRLHVGIANSATVATHVDGHTRRLWGDIAQAGGGNTALEEMQRVMDQCVAHRNARSQHIPLEVSHHLLSNLLDARRTLRVQAGQLTELRTDRDRLMCDLVAALQREDAGRALDEVRKREVGRLDVDARLADATRREERVRWARSAARTTTHANHARAVAHRDRTPIPDRTAVASSLVGVEASRYRVPSLAYRSDKPWFFIFDIILVLMGAVLLLGTVSAISKADGR